jgi:hypothetical protein
VLLDRNDTRLRRTDKAWRCEQELQEQLRSNNAQTPLKTEHHQGPEGEARHHYLQPCTVCKTSIPGSNPGGASKIPNKFTCLVNACLFEQFLLAPKFGSPRRR